MRMKIKYLPNGLESVFKVGFALAAIFINTPTAMAHSPLSLLGYGLQQESSGARAWAMGTASLAAPDSLSLHLFAPALWSGAKIARVGLSLDFNHTTAQDNSGYRGSDEAGFSGAAFVIPLGFDIFAGIAAAPLTRMNYEYTTGQPGIWNPMQITQEGIGGISQVLLGVSVLVGGQLRLGVAARPIFGKISYLQKIEFPGAPSETYASTLTYSDRYKGFGAHISGMWQSGEWTSALSLNTPVRPEVERRTNLRFGSATDFDTTTRQPDKYELPWDIGIGLGKTFKEHLFSSELAWHNWKAVDTPPELNGRLRDGWRIGLGWEWKPYHQPLDPLHRTLIYRGGTYYQKYYALSRGGWQPARFGLTGGIGIPYFHSKSRCDLALELAWSGADRSDAVFERSVALKIAFNHSEIWFAKAREKH